MQVKRGEWQPGILTNHWVNGEGNEVWLGRFQSLCVSWLRLFHCPWDWWIKFKHWIKLICNLGLGLWVQALQRFIACFIMDLQDFYGFKPVYWDPQGNREVQLTKEGEAVQREREKSGLFWIHPWQVCPYDPLTHQAEKDREFLGTKLDWCFHENVI